MPGIPALIFGLLLLVRDGLWRCGTPFKVTALVIVALVLWCKVWHTRDLRAPGINEAERMYLEVVRVTEAMAGKNSIVVSGHFSATFPYYFGRSTPRYDEFQGDRFAPLRGYADVLSYPWYAAVAPHEMEDFAKHLLGKWTPVGKVRDVTILRLDS